MKYITFLVLISFVGLAAFSMVGFDHKINDSMDNCLNSQIDGVPCPTNLAASLIHHTTTYQMLFNTLIPSLILFFILVYFIFWSKDFVDSKSEFLYKRLKDFKLIIHKARHKFIFWLSLLENSPSF